MDGVNGSINFLKRLKRPTYTSGRKRVSVTLDSGSCKTRKKLKYDEKIAGHEPTYYFCYALFGDLFLKSELHKGSKPLLV